MDARDPPGGGGGEDGPSPIAKSLNDVIRFAWMLVAVRWATMAGDQVGELNLRTANAAVLAPASTSVAANVRPTVQVSNATPSFVTFERRLTDCVGRRNAVATFGSSPAVVNAEMLPPTLTFPNARLTGVSAVSVPISNAAVPGPVASPFFSRPTTRPVVRVNGLPAANASVFVPVLMFPLPRSTAPPEPIV